MFALPLSECKRRFDLCGQEVKDATPGEYSADASTGVERLAAGRGRALRNNRAFPLRLIRQSCLAAAGNGF